MKDIDFDELDRAVSSVLGKKASEDNTEQNHDAQTADTTVPETEVPTAQPAGADSDSPTMTQPVHDEPAGDTLEPAKPTPLAVKRRGKFMDVMHPSADMQPNAPAAAGPATKVARTAPMVTPLLTAETEPVEDTSAEPVADLDESATMVGAAPALVESEMDMPDVDRSKEPSAEAAVSETAGLNGENTAEASIPDETDDKQTDDSAANVDDMPQDEGAPQEAPLVEEPQATPFLSDTQVEKRPLGAFGEAETPTGQTDGSGAATDTPVEEPVATAAPAALPRELQPDVVNVESVQEAEAEQAAASTGEASPATVNPFAAKVGVAPDPTDGRVEGHPLFDTSTYHEPIAAVHSHGLPGWAKWALGLLGCLVVGAGVGYFLFAAGL